MQTHMSKFCSRYLISLISIGFVSAALASAAEDMSDLVNEWIGQSEEALLEVWGESRRMAAESGNTLHIYSARGRGGSRLGVSGSVSSVPVGSSSGSAGGRLEDLDGSMRAYGGCDVTFEVRRGVVVEASWSTEGSPDRSKARRTCWREFRRNEAE